MKSIKDESGFTLIELLIALSMTSIMIAALVSAFIVFLDNGSTVSQRDDRSASATLLGSYLDRDFASVNCSVSTSCSVITTPTTTCSGMTNNATMQWTEYSATTADPTPAPLDSFVVAYAVKPDAVDSAEYNATRYEIERFYCASDASTGGLLYSDHEVLALNLQSAPEFCFGGSGTGSCPAGAPPSCDSGTSYVLYLARYEPDTTTFANYSYTGCTEARIQ